MATSPCMVMLWRTPAGIQIARVGGMNQTASSVVTRMAPETAKTSCPQPWRWAPIVVLA